jgi:glycosyltransferase involved in cell wall biosynthesis
MHIVMLADAVYEDAVGGSRVVARELARRMAARGHRVTLVAPRLRSRGAVRPGTRPSESRGGCGESVPSSSYRILRVNHRGSGSLVQGTARAVRDVVAREGADLLHVHFAYPALGLHLRPPDRLPIVRTYYGSWAEESRVEAGSADRKPSLAAQWSLPCRLAAKRAADVLSLRGSRRVIVLSRYSRDEVIEDFGIAAERVDLVPGGVDLDRFRPGDRRAARARLKLPADRRILLTVRRLVPRMGLHSLLSAMPAVLHAFPDTLLVVGGTGPLAATLRERTLQLGLEERVRFVGFIPDGELPAYYQAADYFVLPTRALEGFGLPTLEAFACGTPVLGTPVGATPELLAEVDRALILPGVAPRDLAAGILTALRAPDRPSCTPERLRAFVESRFSWEDVVDATLRVYDRARSTKHEARSSG